MDALMAEYIWLGIAVLSLCFALPTRRLVERGLDRLELWACQKIERRMRDRPIFIYGSGKALPKK
jgi:hypothetical protein